MFIKRLAAVLLVVLFSCPTAAAADLTVRATVDTSSLNQTGRFTLKITFVVNKPPKHPYRVRVAITAGDTVVFRRDHAAPTEPSSCNAGQTVTYQLPSLFPLNGVDALLPGKLNVFVGFIDAVTGKQALPDGAGRSLDGQRLVASFDAPRERKSLSAEAEQTLLEKAAELAKANKPQAAFDRLELGIRASNDYPQKKRLRKAIEKLGRFEPRPLTRVEQSIVASRIQSEKVRWLRLQAGRLHDRKMYHGALKILDEIGGMLEQDSRKAVVGALDAATRVRKSKESIRIKIIQARVARDQAIIDQLKKMKDWRRRIKVLELAQGVEKRGYEGAAWEAYRRARDSGDAYIEPAKQAMRRLEKKWFSQISEAQLKAVQKAKTNPAFDRLVVLPTHKFIYIGPKKLVEGVLANHNATRRFDLAYIFQTDLYGRVPNPGGDRLTVFFKELWDFGGGQGGGKIIDIGRAKKDNTRYRVDTGFLYHELTHNIYTVVPGYPGFTEGIANFGAAFTLDVLDQKGDALHSFRSNLTAFREDYLGRDLAFWRIHKYGPSAGFFLHFVDKYGKRKGQYDWNLYRTFFRGFNRTPIRDGRPRQAIRALAYFFVKAFGDKAFDDLLRFRFPLVESDREAITEEMARGEGRFTDWAARENGLTRYPNSQMHRDRIQRRLASLRHRSPALLKRASEQLGGIIYEWKIAGPFLANTGRSFAEVFPPETGEIDFSKRYEYKKHTAVWREPSREQGKYVLLEKTGWIKLDYAYGKHTSSYAYTKLILPEARSARLYLRTDDHLTVWLNGRHLHKMKNLGVNGGQRYPWRGSWGKAPDEMMLPLSLKKGENILLIKITNGSGVAGFIAAVVGSNGMPMRDMQRSLEPPTPEPELPKALRKKWKRPVVIQGRTLGRLRAKVGSFRLRGKSVLYGATKSKGVAWRKYTVRPGFPKDSPSNLLWLPKKLTQGGGDFRLGLGLKLTKKQLPKMTLTFDGEGGSDGLSGWTLLLQPIHKGKWLRVSLEKYDSLFFRSFDIKLPLSERYLIKLERLREKVTLSINGVSFFKGVHVPPIRVKGSTRIGFATWGPNPGFESIAIVR